MLTRTPLRRNAAWDIRLGKPRKAKPGGVPSTFAPAAASAPSCVPSPSGTPSLSSDKGGTAKRLTSATAKSSMWSKPVFPSVPGR